MNTTKWRVVDALRRWFLLTVAGIGLLFLSVPIVVLALRTLENRAWDSLADAVVPDAIALSLVTTVH